LLTDAMASSERVALGRYTMRGKELLRPYAKGLMLHTLYYADEVKVADEFDRSLNESVKETELTLAKRLIDDLTQKKFDPSQYHDTYRERVIEAAQQKVAGEEVIAAPMPAARGQVIDLMAALKASLEKRGAASRRSTTADADEVEKKVATNAHPQRRAAVDTSVKAGRTARTK
jgi:DNA end-binding protein Ku